MDFKKLRLGLDGSRPIDPVRIFNELAKPTEMNDLFSAQAEVLSEWFEKRDHFRDFVIKLPTGAGKTLVGLLIALSTMREKRGAALYLVESRQLAEQVVAQARSVGISATAYAGPRSVDAEFINGHVVLVGSYQALFNARTPFGFGSSCDPIEPAVVIIDDAHSGFSAVRDAFDVTVNRYDAQGLYDRLTPLLRSAFSDDKGLLLRFDQLSRGEGGTEQVMEVPPWAWARLWPEVFRQLESAGLSGDSGTAKDLRFSLPLLAQIGQCSRAIVSCGSYTVSSYLPMPDRFPTFGSAARRVFMSATLPEDGSIVRAFGPFGRPTSQNGATPQDGYVTMAPRTMAGIGRRLIVPCPTESPGRAGLYGLMREAAEQGLGAVALVPSWARARVWEEMGARAVASEELADAVASLREGAERRPVVFVNRYNGVDLPGDACRLLVVDGIPDGLSHHDRLMDGMFQGSRLHSRDVVRRIEQAMGRGSRGAGDYCSVVLLGWDLCRMVRDHRYSTFFTPSTRAQLEFGELVANELDDEEDLFEVLKQGMRGDSDLASVLAQFVADKVAGEDVGAAADGPLLEFAQVERDVCQRWADGDAKGSFARAKRYGEDESKEGPLRGYMLQVAAQIAYDRGNFDSGNRLMDAAHRANDRLYRAPAPQDAWTPSPQAARLLEIMKGRDRGVNALTRFDTGTFHLSTPKDVHPYEEALKKMGDFMGLTCDRPDQRREGADVVWMDENDSFALVIEVKADKGEEKPLCKTEHAQLLSSEKSFKQTHPGWDDSRVIVHHNWNVDKDVPVDGTRVFSPVKALEVRDALRSLWASVLSAGADVDAQARVCDQLLDEYSLRARPFVGYWTAPFVSAGDSLDRVGC